MSSAAYAVNVSKSKDCGPNQTGSDVDPHFLRSTHLPANNVSKYFAAEYLSRCIFADTIWVNIV